MYFKYQFLVEDLSGTALIKAVMKKILAEYPDIECDYKSFKGIGGLPWKQSAKETKTGKLLNDLAIYLRGFNRSLQFTPSALVVVLDNDTRNTESFYQKLNDIAVRNCITIDHVFCIAVEEMEAWLLGDESAVMSAYPTARLKSLRAYEQDSICGIWEVLADVVYPGGLTKFEKDCPTYVEKGKYKSEWAESIGQYMELNNNKSPSFRNFILEIQKRIPEAS